MTCCITGANVINFLQQFNGTLYFHFPKKEKTDENENKEIQIQEKTQNDDFKCEKDKTT